MSSYLGTPWEPQPFQYKSDVPLDLVARGLAYKQGQTDNVKQQMQGYLDNIGNTQFYRDSDRAIVNSRLNETVNSLNGLVGQDLTDGRTQSEMMGVVNGLSTDPNVVDRIMANRNVGKQLQRIQYIKEHKPEQYSGVNEDYFNKQVSQWQKDPNKVSFNGTYQPYVDTAKWYQKAAEDIAKNPDISNEIQYTTVNGIRVPRSEEEIKQVTLKKLREGLLGGMPGDVRAQYQLEYNNAMMDNGLPIAMQMVNNNMDDVQARMDDLNYALDQSSFKPGSEAEAAAREQVRQYETHYNTLRNKRNDLMSGHLTPQDMMPFSGYLDDKMTGVAKGYAYKQDKIEDKGLGMAMLKHSWDQADEVLKANLKKQAEQSGPFSNGLISTFLDLGSPKGQAAITDDKDGNTFRALLNITGSTRKADDGFEYYPISLTNTPLFADMKPVVNSVVPEADNRAVAGYQAINEGWLQYKKEHEAMYLRPQQGAVTNAAGYAWSSPVIKNPDPNVGYVAPVPAFSDYLADLRKQPNMIDNFKDNYGLDLNDDRIMVNSNAVNKKVSAITSNNIGTSSVGNGTISVRPQGGMNARRTGNNYHIGVVARGTYKELAPAVGGENVFDAWQSSGYVKDLKIKDKDGNKLYETNLWLPSSADVKAMVNNFNIATYGAGYVKDHADELLKAGGDAYATAVQSSNLLPYVPQMAAAIKNVAPPEVQKMVVENERIISDPTSSSVAQHKAIAAIKACYDMIPQK